MTQNYITSDQRKILLDAARELFRSHGAQTRKGDLKTLKTLTESAVEADLIGRDQQGRTPTMLSLNTALLLSRLVAPDRNMTLATMLAPLCQAGAVDLKGIAKLYDDDIAHLVEGLVRVTRLYGRQTAVADENFQKLLLSFADDIRVILIMIVDRLALIRTLGEHSDEKTVAGIANEARYLYAPLAHRLGLYAIKSELEDLSLKCLNRQVYTQIARKLSESKASRDRYVADFIAPVSRALTEAGLKFDIKGRTKSINSIWNKMLNQGVDVDGIYDLFAIRIILDSAPEQEKRDCWVAYSIVTDMYTANTSRLRDWITIPKSNGYESLHITVNGPQEKWVEVQIRTRRMDEVAERGLAAHWRYKGIKSEQNLDAWMTGVREVLEAGQERRMDAIKGMNMNIYDKEVFVFTPRGDLFKLPKDASVLDFAFAIHTRVGSTCTGARVNGKNQRISYRLRNGDTVEVLTSSTQTPKLDWLNVVVTSKARTKIKLAVNEHRIKQADMAKEMLLRRFKNRKKEFDEATISRMLKRLGFKSMIDFYVALHNEEIDVTSVLEEYDRQVARQTEGTPPPVQGTAEDFVLHDNTRTRNDDDILIIGDDIRGINYKLSKCCNPIFGDKIVGFIASDGAIKIHRADCGNVHHLKERYPYRMIRSAWSGKIGTQFAATLRVLGKDDIGIVSNITSLINKTGDTQLRSVSITSNAGMFEGMLVVGVNSLASLDDLIGKISALRGVKSVERRQQN